MTVSVPMRQTKDVHQHLSWDNGPVFKDLKKTTPTEGEAEQEEDTGRNPGALHCLVFLSVQV